MFQFLSRALHGERGATARFLAALFLMIACFFAFLSNLSCENGGGNGCGSGGPVNSSGSQEVFVQSINKAAFDAGMAGPVGPFTPGATVQRTLSYSGAGVTRMVWTPPPGATSFDFSASPPRQVGGPPFTFLSPPSSFTVTYNLPGLPAGVDSRKVSETLQCFGADGSSSNASLVNTIQRTAASAAEGQSPVIAPQGAATARTISAYKIDQYRSIANDSMTTTQCQTLFDWLQGRNAFTALRVPVTPAAPGSSFPLPVIFGPDANTRPVLKFTVNGSPFSGIPDVPLEVRPDRSTYLENNLPAAAGEAWLALGAATSPAVTCPQTMNATGWEFHVSFPVDPVGKTNNLPFYYCYEGAETPPVAVAAAQVLAGTTAPAMQAEGITCLGPQDQPLVTNPVLHIGNPGAAWNVIPPSQQSFMHYLTETTITSVNLTFSSNLPGSTWAFYKGTDSAPNMAQPITNPWTPSSTFQFFWLVGSVPAGAVPGTYSITVTATKAGDPAIATHTNDLLWVGEWQPPTGGPRHIFLPSIRK